MKKDFLDEAIAASKQAFIFVMLFSFASNILMLALPIYTLQVLDRVISSGSMETLGMLTIITVVMLIALGAFKLSRRMILTRVGEWLDDKVGKRILATSISISSINPGVSGAQNSRDFNTVKSFIAGQGQGLIAIFDAPWSIIYFIIIYMISPTIFAITIAGAVIIIFAALLNLRAVKSTSDKANDLTIKSMHNTETMTRNSETIEAMGMMDAILARWDRGNREARKWSSLAINRSSIISEVSGVVRLVLQIIIMGTGAYLVIKGDTFFTVGGMIACSILMGRAFAPLDAAINSLTAIAAAKKSYDSLKKAISAAPVREQTMNLPVPKGNLSVEKLLYMVPNTKIHIIKGINFSLAAGESLGIIGPSAAGKTTLAKLMVGVYQPFSGVVRLDSADVYTWNRQDFGRHIGYLPQGVELFEGTVRDNIARMQDDITDEEVIRAAQITGVHDMILRLVNGYDTEIGVGGMNLSAGQRQRIGLARAFFRDPKFLVLDEPNSNLDDMGEHALIMALKNAKALKMTAVIIAHRPTVLNFVDKIMVMKEGIIADFGPGKEILQKYSQAAIEAQKAKQKQQALEKKTGANTKAVENKPTKPAETGNKKT